MIKSGILEVSNDQGTLFYANKENPSVYIGGFKVESAGLIDSEDEETQKLT